MSIERNKNTLKRDQALNDATSGKFGEEPRPKPLGRGNPSESKTDDNIRDSHVKTARKMSRDM